MYLHIRIYLSPVILLISEQMVPKRVKSYHKIDSAYIQEFVENKLLYLIVIISKSGK